MLKPIENARGQKVASARDELVFICDVLLTVLRDSMLFFGADQPGKEMLVNSDFYEDLALTIKSVSLQSKRNIGKILIMGEDLQSICNAIIQVFPNAYYVVSNESENILNHFTHKLSLSTSIKTRVLDIFDGSSLTDFYLEFGKFDLILLSRIFDDYELSNRKKRSSIVFLHKNFLNINGLFTILNGEEELTEDLISLLKKIKAFKKVIKSYQKQDKMLKYLIFTKKSRLKLFGD